MAYPVVLPSGDYFGFIDGPFVSSSGRRYIFVSRNLVYPYIEETVAYWSNDQGQTWTEGATAATHAYASYTWLSYYPGDSTKVLYLYQYSTEYPPATPDWLMDLRVFDLETGAWSAAITGIQIPEHVGSAWLAYYVSWYAVRSSDLVIVTYTVTGDPLIPPCTYTIHVYKLAMNGAITTLGSRAWVVAVENDSGLFGVTLERIAGGVHGYITIPKNLTEVDLWHLLVGIDDSLLWETTPACNFTLIEDVLAQRRHLQTRPTCPAVYMYSRVVDLTWAVAQGGKYRVYSAGGTYAEYDLQTDFPVMLSAYACHPVSGIRIGAIGVDDYLGVDCYWEVDLFEGVGGAVAKAMKLYRNSREEIDMSTWLKQSTAATVKMGPFVDDVDGYTPETGLSIAQADIRVSKNGGAFAQTHNATGATHDENGYYGVPLDTTDTATLGSVRVAIFMAGALPVWQDFQILPANVYDSLIAGTDLLQTDVDPIWDEAISGHLGAGSVGAALNAAGSSGDPWTTPLPGVYGAGTAGKLVSDMNTLVGAAKTNTDLIPAVKVGTDLIAAVKAKTDLIPAAPAAVSDIPTAIQNADALLKRNMASVTGEADRSMLNALRFLRNKWQVSAGVLTVMKENDSTVAWTGAVDEDVAALPVVGVDPA